jgi:hypothetical protein
MTTGPVGWAEKFSPSVAAKTWMAAHSRSKNGVLSHACGAGMTVKPCR